MNPGNTLYYEQNENNSNSGFEFIVDIRIADQIQTIKKLSSRVAYLILRIAPYCHMKIKTLIIGDFIAKLENDRIRNVVFWLWRKKQ